MLLARLSSLPDTSALHAAVQGAPRGWGGDRHALVTIIDALQQNTFATVKVAGGKARKPKALTRPKSPRKRTTVTVAQLIAGKGSV